MNRQKRHGDRSVGLTLIAIGKLIKVSLLLATGVAALTMAHRDPPATLIHWADVVGVDTGNRWLYELITKVAGASAKQLEELGVGSFVYAAVFSVEGVGLWMQKKWAEYVTVIVTMSFLPLEIYEVAHHFSAAKVVTLVLNVAVVVYLVVRLMGERRAHAPLGSASR
jgi:uncharacterized membrane protein (DUF2068 family)